MPDDPDKQFERLRPLFKAVVGACAVLIVLGGGVTGYRALGGPTLVFTSDLRAEAEAIKQSTRTELAKIGRAVLDLHRDRRFRLLQKRDDLKNKLTDPNATPQTREAILVLLQQTEDDLSDTNATIAALLRFLGD